MADEEYLEKYGIKKGDVREYYEIGDLLGSGAFSQVFKGTEKATLETYAIKVMNKRKVKPRLLDRELSIMTKTRHPYILECKGIFENEKEISLVLELIDGGELYDSIVEYGEYNEIEAKSIVCQILCAIEYLHSNNIVHRDIKPENILCKLPPKKGEVRGERAFNGVDQNTGAPKSKKELKKEAKVKEKERKKKEKERKKSEREEKKVSKPKKKTKDSTRQKQIESFYSTSSRMEWVKLGDFGLARTFDPMLTPNGQNTSQIAGNLVTRCGSPTYVSPEVLLGEKYGQGVDLWALGVCTYVILTGCFPFFEGEDYSLLYRKIIACEYCFPSEPKISDGAKSFVRALLVADPAKRLTVSGCRDHPWLKGAKVPMEV